MLASTPPLAAVAPAGVFGLFLFAIPTSDAPAVAASVAAASGSAPSFSARAVIFAVVRRGGGDSAVRGFRDSGSYPMFGFGGGGLFGFLS